MPRTIPVDRGEVETPWMLVDPPASLTIVP